MAALCVALQFIIAPGSWSAVCPLPLRDLSIAAEPAGSPNPSPSAPPATWVFIDGSGSMAGYARARSQTGPNDRIFVDVMSGLPVALRAAAVRGGPTPVFHRFGKRIQPLPDKILPDIGRLEFYACTGKPDCDNQESHIDDVLKVAGQVGPNDLVVIVTDLFLSEQHIVGSSAAALRNALSEILRGGKSIGILGLKAGFRGRLSDLATPGVTYSGAEQVPFYILAIGPSDRVERFYSVMDTEFLKQLPPESHRFAVFTTNIVKRPLRADEIARDLLRFGIGARGTSFLPPGGGAELAQYKLKRSAAAAIGTLSVRDNLTQHAVRPSKIAVKQQVWALDDRARDCTGMWQATKDQGMSLLSANVADDTLHLTFGGNVLALSAWPIGRRYLFQFQVSIQDIDVDAPETRWLREWGYEAKDESKLLESKPKFFPTLNLPRLAKAMESIVRDEFKDQPLLRIAIAIELER